jgi:predicted PurR-regulated permease PerM
LQTKGDAWVAPVPRPEDCAVGDDAPPEATSAVPAEEERIPLPEDVRTALLTGIFTLFVLYTFYFAREIVMPILFAFLLNLLLQPAMRLLARLRIPPVVGACLVILVLFGTFIVIFSSLAAPAADWFGKLPQSLPRLEGRFYFLSGIFARLQQANEELNRLAPQSSGAMSVVVQGSGIGSIIFASTRDVLTGLFTTIIVLFFLLVSGDLFLRKLVEILPRFRDKKRAVAISQEVERNISAYLVTISCMNLLVGIGVGATAYFSGMGEPLLWGVVAFLLNYIPILGPMAGIVLTFLAGMLAFDSLWQSALIAGIYFGIHLLEGEVVTPMLVARRFTLNPVLVIVSLIFWYWMWSVPGAIMAVPLLATMKIICDHVQPLRAFGHFLGG